MAIAIKLKAVNGFLPTMPRQEVGEGIDPEMTMSGATNSIHLFHEPENNLERRGLL